MHLCAYLQLRMSSYINTGYLVSGKCLFCGRHCRFTSVDNLSRVSLCLMRDIERRNLYFLSPCAVQSHPVLLIPCQSLGRLLSIAAECCIKRIWQENIFLSSFRHDPAIAGSHLYVSVLISTSLEHLLHQSHLSHPGCLARASVALGTPMKLTTNVCDCLQPPLPPQPPAALVLVRRNTLSSPLPATMQREEFASERRPQRLSTKQTTPRRRRRLSTTNTPPTTISQPKMIWDGHPVISSPQNLRQRSVCERLRML